MNEEGAKFLTRKIGASLDQIEKINLKEDFSVKLKNGKVEHIDLDALGPIVRHSCIACTDFSNYSADISVGGVGSPEGYTTVLARSQAAQRLINLAIRQGYLEEAQSEGALKKIWAMAERKKLRGEQVFAEKKLQIS
jgi:coenzyme F420 hydrogenase subunit beta